ncbi:MAG: hypothetical protein PF692_05165 [Kiritimatiellae bacterium]|jgi:hypothetical protein|nr:hypothetical protein [Kiritimatiellia bacterium]
MNKVSKSFFLGSTAIGFGIVDVLLVISDVWIKTSSPEAGLGLLGLSYILVLFGEIVLVVLLYKSWAAIQDGHARTTPGKAIGFLFIPFFNIYWAFQATWGLSKDFNAYLQRNSISVAALPEGLFLSFCILSITAWIPIPIPRFVLPVVFYIFGLIMVSTLCDAINAVAEKPHQQ